jgi:CBS domain-containing protein
VAENKDLVCIHDDTPLETALHKMDELGISALPIKNSEDCFMGIISLQDVVLHLVSSERALGQRLDTRCSALLGKSAPGKVLGMFEAEDRMDTVLLHLPELRRALVRGKHGTGHWYRILTETDVARFVVGHRDCLGGLMSLPVNQIRRVKAEEMVVAHAESNTVLDVLEKMSKADVSAVPVLDSDGKVIDTFALADLAGVRKSSLGMLSSPVLEFLRTRKNRPPRDLTCRPETSVGAALELLVPNAVNRLWVTDESHHVVTVIAISDLIYAIDRELSV